MRWLLTSPLRTLSPLGLVAVGTVIGAAGVPVIKKTARSLAVLTVRGALAISDALKETGEGLTKSWEKMVHEVRVQQSIMDQPAGKAATSMVAMHDTQDVVNHPSATAHTNKEPNHKSSAEKKES
ncbi:hypothetical protein [Desulforamulus hydrothermalis]|uniref:Uncharacterized protein n=1 Tax=Desulforamulus hydrothermalis Lam5 = DSM 18033 TaxID=1121428 RepID=K8E8A9_9FIRM|nr:hypothetical protein [Desulforamulus hydrothermalis]CCO07738.1 exported hypothetical protein [Desulforamulus hydrothermalis Lam5 = DSM 18033]SHH34154.1 hypothetical protein SAMN02745177_02251 [Desulforamulus hydrothermalis Lam5 = DSM 18033]